MTLKPPSLPKRLDESEAPDMARTITRAYQVKLESLQKREDSGIISLTYQTAEHGQVDFSANGSPTTVRTFALAQKYNSIVYVNAHAAHKQFISPFNHI